MTLLVIADDEAVLGKLPDAPSEVLVSCGVGHSLTSGIT